MGFCLNLNSNGFDKYLMSAIILALTFRVVLFSPQLLFSIKERIEEVGLWNQGPRLNLNDNGFRK